MHPAWTKRQHAQHRLARAGYDPDLLGSALLGFPGALEDELRAWIAAHPRIPPEERVRAADPRQVRWNDVLNLAQQYGMLPRQPAADSPRACPAASVCPRRSIQWHPV